MNEFSEPSNPAFYILFHFICFTLIKMKAFHERGSKPLEMTKIMNVSFGEFIKTVLEIP